MIFGYPFGIDEFCRRIKYSVTRYLVDAPCSPRNLIKYDIFVVTACHAIRHPHPIGVARVQDVAGVLLFPADDFRHSTHLHDAKRRPKFIEPVIHSLDFVLRATSVIAIRPEVPFEVGIGRDRDPAFAGGDGLCRVERKDAGVAKCARLHAVPFGSDGMGTILDQRDSIGPAIFGDTMNIERDVPADVHDVCERRLVPLCFLDEVRVRATQVFAIAVVEFDPCSGAQRDRGVARKVFEGQRMVLPATWKKSRMAAAAPAQLSNPIADSSFQAFQVASNSSSSSP